ncbi:Folate-biopterin transporter 1, chloroplastic, partial [Mucuna pruriens]
MASPVVVGVPNHASIFGDNFLDVNSMDDDNIHVLHGEATIILDLHVCTMTINGLVGGNQELLPQLNDHVVLEYTPQWALLDNGKMESSHIGIDHVVIRVVDLSHGDVVVTMVYFVQGVLGLERLVVNFYLKDDLHLDFVEAVVIFGFSTLHGLSNLYERSYLVLSRLISAFSWSLMATFVDNKYNLWRGHMVSHKEPQDLFSLYVGVLWLLEELFNIASEKKIFVLSGQDFWKAQNIALFSYGLCDSLSNSAMFYFTTNSLGFTLVVLGCVKLVTSIASLLGVGHYNGFMNLTIGSQHIPFGASP